jgi:hypothetical protein
MHGLKRRRRYGADSGGARESRWARTHGRTQEVQTDTAASNEERTLGVKQAAGRFRTQARAPPDLIPGLQEVTVALDVMVAFDVVIVDWCRCSVIGPASVAAYLSRNSCG